jgi:hypothetical protein
MILNKMTFVRHDLGNESKLPLLSIPQLSDLAEHVKAVAAAAAITIQTLIHTLRYPTIRQDYLPVLLILAISESNDKGKKCPISTLHVCCIYPTSFFFVTKIISTNLLFNLHSFKPLASITELPISI